MTQATYWVPTRDEIRELEVGSIVLNQFNKASEVVEIIHRGVDFEGRLYVGYATRFAGDQTLTDTLVEGRIHLSADNHLTGRELDGMESLLNDILEFLDAA